MTAPVIAFTSVANSQTPTFDTDLYLPTAGAIAYLTIGRDPTFGFYDQIVGHTLTQPEIDGLGFDWAIGVIYNGVNYFRVTFNTEISNTLTDTISGSIEGPLYGDTHDGKGHKPPPKKKAEEVQASLPEFPQPLEVGSNEPRQLQKLPASITRLLKEKAREVAREQDISVKQVMRRIKQAEDDEIGFVMGMIH